MPNELIDIACDKIAETDKGLLISDGDKREWVPKSQVEMEQKADSTWCCTMPLWLAKQKGFI